MEPEGKVPIGYQVSLLGNLEGDTPARDHFFLNRRDHKPGGATIRATFMRHFGQTTDVLPTTCCVRSCDSYHTERQPGLVQRYFAPLPLFPSLNTGGGGPVGSGAGASAGFSTTRSGNFRAGAFACAGTASCE
jgi:hypothetical protein